MSITTDNSDSYTSLLLGQLEDFDSCIEIYRKIDSSTAVSAIIATQNYVDNKITGAINASY